MADSYTPLVNANGTLNDAALLEQIGGLVALYWGDQTNGQKMVDLCGGGEILVWHFEPAAQLPCISLVRQENTFYVWIAGTVNVGQWIGNVIGAIAPKQFVPKVYVQQFFWDLANTLLAFPNPHFPPVGTGAKFVVVGHSLGGAIAQIIGAALGTKYGPDAVTVLAVAQPKAFTSGLVASEHWGVYHRVRVPGDPVPMLPPDDPVVFFLTTLPPLQSNSAGFRWLHYGTGWLLSTSGGLSPDPGQDYWDKIPGSWLTSPNLQRHLIGNIAKYAALS